MGVIGSYEAMRRIQPLGRGPVGIGQLVAPPGVSTSASSGLEIWDNLVEMLQLPTIGIYTPWAGRDGLDWIPVRQPPDTNILVAALNDATLAQAQTISFGAALPWIGILSDRAPMPQEVAQALRGTPYEFFQTQAVYAQNDSGEPPMIRFIHWARLRDQADQEGGTGSVAQVAQVLQGQLAFVAQVNYDTSSQRTPPQLPFEQALASQFPGQATPVQPPPGGEIPAPPGGEPWQPPPPPPVAPWKPYVVPMAATALAFGIGGFFALRAMRKKGGRAG